MIFSGHGVFDFFRIRRARSFLRLWSRVLVDCDADRRSARDCRAWRVKKQGLDRIGMTIDALLVDPGAHIRQEAQPGPNAGRDRDGELSHDLQSNHGQAGNSLYRAFKSLYLREFLSIPTHRPIRPLTHHPVRTHNPLREPWDFHSHRLIRQPLSPSHNPTAGRHPPRPSVSMVIDDWQRYGDLRGRDDVKLGFVAEAARRDFDVGIHSIPWAARGCCVMLCSRAYFWKAHMVRPTILSDDCQPERLGAARAE